MVEFKGYPQWLLGSCDAVSVAYYCLTHQESFPTKQHAAKHVTEGDHAIVRWCPKHGLETAAKPNGPGTS